MPKIDVFKIQSYTGHKDAIYGLSAAKEDDFFISGGGDGMVVRWKLSGSPDGELIAKVPNSVYSVCFLADRNLAVAGHNYEGIHLIDLSSRKEVASVKFTDSAIFDIKSYEGYLIAACGDGTVAKITLDPLKVRKTTRNSSLSARTLAINGKAGHLAVGYSDNHIRIFDINSFDLIREFVAHKNSVFALTYSPDLNYLLSGSRDAHLKIWDSNRNYSLHKSVVAHLYAINHISYSPDGSHFATCSMDKTIKVWSASESRLLKVIDNARHGGHVTSVNRLFWSAYHNRLVSCSDDRTIISWEIHFNTEEKQ